MATKFHDIELKLVLVVSPCVTALENVLMLAINGNQHGLCEHGMCTICRYASKHNDSYAG